MLKATELQALSPEEKIVPWARFVLALDGTIRVVELDPGALRFVDENIARGIPGDGRVVHMDEGLVFLEQLPRVYSGSWLWATPVFEIDEDQAFKPHSD
jgi:hypothetical protein